MLVDNNQVVRTDNDAARLAAWCGLNIGQTLIQQFPAVWGMFVAIGEKHVLVNASRIRWVTRQIASAVVHSNRFQSSGTRISLIDIDSVETCLFTGNHCHVTGPFGVNSPPVGRIVGLRINASNNRLIGIIGEQKALELTCDENRFVALGNLSFGPIYVVENAVSRELPSPWKELNVLGPD